MTSREPCPRCLGALYWARARRVVYAATRQEAAEAGFDDAFIYREINLAGEERKIPFVHLPVDNVRELFELWREQGESKMHCRRSGRPPGPRLKTEQAPRPAPGLWVGPMGRGGLPVLFFFLSLLL